MPAMLNPSPLLGALDLVGIFVFGLSGGTLAVRRRLDIFGVVVLALAAALAGGLTRDVLIGSFPPAALQNSQYLIAALASGLFAFFAHQAISRLGKPVMVLDALGLGIFAVTGCERALAAGLAPLPAVLLALLTAIGGGVARDLLVTEVPRVLREEIYAVAALLGAVLFVAGTRLDLPEVLVATVATLATFLLRVVSVLRGWSAPRASGS